MSEPDKEVEEPQANEEFVEPEVKRRRRVERRYRFAPHKRQPLPQLKWWREALLVVFLLTAVLFIINPFPRLAQARATAGQPAEPLAVTPPANPEEGYCLAGDFQEWSGVDTPLFDDGTEGDRTAGDNIYSRTITFDEPGRYLWRVLPCGKWDTAVPERSAWFFVTTPDQPITFTFNPSLPPGKSWPRSYAMAANDTLPARVVAVGTFQNRPWNNEDRQTQLAPSGNNQFELATRIQLPGQHETYVVVQGRNEGIGASGRSMQPVPLVFTTQFPSEMVVFQYDGRTERIAVLYGIPWWLGWLSYGWGARIFVVLSLLGTFVIGAQIAYQRVVLRPDKQYSAGCPNCHQHDLQRISRETPDYLMDLVGIPVRRYKCNQCGWQGRRIYSHHRRH